MHCDRAARIAHPLCGASDRAAGARWLDTFGRSAADPQFDDYVAEVKRYYNHEVE